MLKKIFIAFFISAIAIPGVSFAATVVSEDLNYTTLTIVDLNTFNEYRYKITEKFFELKSKFEINGNIDSSIANNILEIAVKGYNYLPDNLVNKNLFNNLKTSIERGIKYPDNSSNYTEIKAQIINYIEKVDIKKVSGSIDAYPSKGNAPLTVTFRAKITDPSGTKIPNYNYVWWMDVGGKRKVLSQTAGPSFNYTFTEEGNFSIFLDVTSEHKNVKGYTDVIPFRSREDIQIEEKIASLILKVNSSVLREKTQLKFTPQEAKYGLIFDATSSTPTGGSKFTSVEWDFGNGVTRKYTGNPQVERVIYSKEGDYSVLLKLRTNEGKSVERRFDIIIHDPIATIKSNIDEGYLGDKFTFSSESGINEDNLTYEWEIIDISKDKIIFTKTGKLFTYSFLEKGQYNVKLKVTEPSSNIPDIDTKIIYINSRAPVVDFKGSIPYPNKPNTVLLDATKTFDPDFSDEGKLIFSWIIDGIRVELENPNYNGSNGYYTFDSIGDHSVVLEVSDPDNITIQKKDKINVKSILSVDFGIYPRVAIREQLVSFIADSLEARVYEWDFGDGEKVGGSYPKIQHKYIKSGVFKVKLKVVDKNDNINTFIKEVYIGQSDYPLAFIKINSVTNNEILFNQGECNGNGAYILDRINSVKLSGEESININGEAKNLTYSWKLDDNKYYNTASFEKKFDELGCFPVKLTVKSNDNGKTDSKTIWIKVENLKPVLSSIDFSLLDETTDPVVVNITAVGAKDLDGVIQNYLWYYYTDIDPEPQDFRSTRNPNTTFVLPKVTGNYYFVVVMKDNNEMRVSSEDMIGTKYFITLTGDNLNTPLIKLNVNNSSVFIGDEVTFTTQVENILLQDISKNVEYSWDFDGDGFYEKENNSPTVSYIFNTSGEFHTKVKVKNKGFSNTKSITVSVANILKPDFSYISIGNKFIFLDNSKGSYSNIEWSLGDGNVIKDKKSFVYEYSDNETSHEVTIKLIEGTKIKTFSLKVIKNVKNYLKSKKPGLVYFSNVDIVDDKLNIDELKNLYVYLKESKGNIKYYGIDYDLNYDSDLNGGKDDDIDNKNDSTYTSGDPILIKLNDQKEQKVRLILLDKDSKLIESYDFTIIKSYIENTSIDINALNFNGVSESEKLKIEKLKNYISNIDKEYKLKSLMYIQKLQEEWFDNREKTNVILEFENYITEIDITDGTDIINVLESLLVEGQEDKSEKSIIYNALKNLIPVGINCKIELGVNDTCYNALIKKLDTIKDNSNVEENKAIGIEILKVIETDVNMTNKQKLDFKEILKTFIYGGIENIPEDVIQDNTPNIDTNQSSLLSLIGKVFYFIFIIILIFGIFIFLFYVWYKIKNKDSNIGFQDFIIEKTSNGHKSDIKTNIKKEELDIFSNIKEIEESDDINEEKINKKENIFNFDNDIETKKETKKEVVEEELEEELEKEEETNFNDNFSNENIEDKKIPDWLRGSFDEKPKEVIKSKEKEVIKKEEAKEVIKLKEEEKEEEEIKFREEKIPTNEELDEFTKITVDSTIEEDKKIPDWLRGSFDEKPKEVIKSKEEEKEEDKKDKEEKIPTNEELDEFTKITVDSTVEEDKKIPDWLRGSFDEKPKEVIKSKEKEVIKLKEEEKEEKKEKDKEEDKKDKEEKKIIIDKNISKGKKISKNKVDEIKKHNTKKIEEKEDKINKEDSENIPKVDSDLWDDGMKIPDWLKTDGDK